MFQEELFVNIKEIFDKAENGTLTYAQFEAQVKEAGAKFTDLSEGKYVDRRKYEDEIKAKDDSIAQLNSTISQRDTDLADLQTKLKSAGTDATKLSELQTSFDTLQSKYTTDMEAYQKKLADQQYEFASREYANTLKFTSKGAKRDFTTALIDAKLKYDNGTIIGADDFRKKYAENDADAFVKEDDNNGNNPPAPQPNNPTPKPHFAGPTGGTNQGGEKPFFGFNFTPIRPIDKKD